MPKLPLAKSLTVKDTVNLLVGDGTSSPNDMVCIMANGKAGNYKISCEDTEFSKFTFALRKVLTEICRRLAMDCDKEGRVFMCKVSGATSQQVARAVAKNVVASFNIRRAILQGVCDMESILYAINSATDTSHYAQLQLTLEGGGNSYALLEEGMTTMRLEKTHLLKLLEGNEIVLKISLSDGNYGSMALGCLEPREIST